MAYDPLDLLFRFQMHKRGCYRLLIGFNGVFKSSSMSGRLDAPQPALAPQDSGRLFD
jgi:hypothetical protein